MGLGLGLSTWSGLLWSATGGAAAVAFSPAAAVAFGFFAATYRPVS